MTEARSPTTAARAPDAAAAGPGAVPAVIARLVAALATALVGLLLAATPAAAHPAVETSSPAAGAVIEAPPPSVSITFNEGVEAPLGSVRVYDLASERVDLDDARLAGADERTATVSLPPDLADGTYIVIWRAIGLDDGHLVLGQQHFTVDRPGGPVVVAGAPIVPDQLGGGTTTTLATVTATTSGTATAVVSGLVLFALVVLRGRDARWRRVRLAVTGLVRLLAAVAAGAAVLQVVATAVDRAAAFGTPLDVATVATTLVSAGGLAAVARALLLLPLLAPPLLRVRWFVLGATTLATATLAVDGHIDGAALLAAVVHVLVVATWAGGLVGLVVALRLAPDDDADGALALLGRFSGLAATTVAVAAVTGATVALATTGGAVTDVAATPWGRMLSTKALLVVAALLVAAHTRVVLLPALRRTTRAVPAGAAVDVAAPLARSVVRDSSWGALRRNVALEVLLVTLVLVVSGGLGTLDPNPATAATDADGTGHDDGGPGGDEECAIEPVPVGMALAHDC